MVYYILANNSLTVTTFLEDSDTWLLPTNLVDYIAAADSRYLSGANYFGNTILFYESSKGSVVALNGPYTKTGIQIWKDISGDLQDSTPLTGLRFSAPFGVMSSDIELYAVFAGKQANESYSGAILTTYMSRNLDGHLFTGQ